MNIKILAAVASFSLWYAVPSLANNGTQLTGYGARAAGMGGASVALPLDSFAAANNPAGMAEVGTRFDGNLRVLYVHSDVEFLSENNDKSGSLIIPVPEVAFNYQLSPDVTLGLSTAGSGIGFAYDDPLLPIPGLVKAKGSLQQVVALPTLGYKLNENISVGLSLAIAAQRFRVQGIPLPDGSGGLPSHGYEMAYGGGWRTGVLWKINEQFSLGASYASKINMSKMSGYKDDLLSAANGSIDIPEQYAFGIAYMPTPGLSFALDWQHIAWDNVAAYNRLFGWRSQDVYRAGVNYELDDRWSVRGGISHARRQFQSDFTANNVIPVAINPDAITVGFTRKFDGGSELTVGYEYDLPKSVKGTGPSTGSKIDTDLSFLTIGYGLAF
ncbi:OmpP1/FadL family transporter [Pseudomonas sp. MDT1-16]